MSKAASAPERFYRDMFEHAVWGMFQTTPDGHYLNANPALARVYGYDTPQAMMAALTDIGSQLYVEPTRREEFVGLMRENGAVVGFESTVHRRDGAVIWISESCREVRGSDGALVPLGTLVEAVETSGPELVQRYNMYPSVPVNGNAAAGTSSGQALALMEGLARGMQAGYAAEWTELAYQQSRTGNTAVFIFALSVLFVFLVLAAQYESWSLPLAIVLIVPMGVLSALAGVWARGMDNNILTQIGLVVLVALATKNAILIVEFARQLEQRGQATIDALVDACRLRLRPILMTALAFILGVAPLVVATGPSAEMRQVLGTAVFAGMLGVTAFGLILTPAFYAAIRALLGRRGGAKEAAAE